MHDVSWRRRGIEKQKKRKNHVTKAMKVRVNEKHGHGQENKTEVTDVQQRVAEAHWR
jgi:hypothetical protein